MAQQQTVSCYNVDADGVFLYTTQRRGYGARMVAVAPPEIPVGQLAYWKSDKHEFADPTWRTDGQWILATDNRKATLYSQDGEYSLKADHNGDSYNGIGDLPDWLTLIPRPSQYHDLVDGQWTLDAQAQLDGTRTSQLAVVNAAFESAAAALTTGYPEAERLTWSVQQQEALAWQADNSAATPYLDGLAAARGITAAEMRSLTLAQVQAFMAASQQMVGTRQKLRDQINAATTVEEMLAVQWPA